jgi:hypothetical protein
MSDGFTKTFDFLRQEVHANSSRHFGEAQSHHPCLAEYPNLKSVLEVIRTAVLENWPERERLARAILAEYQRTHFPYWGAVLLVLFYPMLRRLRNKVHDAPLGSDDLDQLVIASFLGVIASFSPLKCPYLVALRLRQRTQGVVFGVLKREAAVCELTQMLRTLVEETNWEEFVDELDVLETDGSRDQLKKVISRDWQKIPLNSRLLLFLTVNDEDSLRRYAQWMTGENESEARVYARLRKRQARAVKGLREKIQAENEGPVGAEFPRNEKRAKGNIR